MNPNIYAQHILVALQVQLNCTRGLGQAVLDRIEAQSGVGHRDAPFRTLAMHQQIGVWIIRRIERPSTA